MNTPRDEISTVLRDWRVNPPSDPNFRHSVWQRIRRRQGETWAAYLRAHAATWALVAVLALGAGSYTGYATARARARADREAIVTTYLVDLDPRVLALHRP